MAVNGGGGKYRGGGAGLLGGLGLRSERARLCPVCRLGGWAGGFGGGAREVRHATFEVLA